MPLSVVAPSPRFDRAIGEVRSVNLQDSSSRAAFSGDTWFDEAAFSAGANFYKATFSMVWFFEAKFHKGAFREAVFSDLGQFNEAVFSGDADFDRAKFFSELDITADFYKATFSRRLAVKGALISNSLVRTDGSSLDLSCVGRPGASRWSKIIFGSPFCRWVGR